MVKRIFDILFAMFGLLLFLPFFVLIVVMIKLNSPGPVIYRGIRMGRFGKPFRIYKFRTMILNAEKCGGGTTALHDPRITRIGVFFRKYKIDEIPQLLNVINGDMSIVGPRPELIAYTQKYNEKEMCILNVRPGITDLSSIEFNSLDECVGSVDADRVFEEYILPRKNKLRINYVKNQSFWLDIKIIFKTIWIVLEKFIKHNPIK